jgi:hypothetical protein
MPDIAQIRPRTFRLVHAKTLASQKIRDHSAARSLKPGQLFPFILARPSTAVPTRASRGTCTSRAFMNIILEVGGLSCGVD